MPNYDYECPSCGHQEEILQKMTENALNICPNCHQSTFKRKFGAGIGLQFQGSGFYSTDYGTPSSSPSASSPKETGSPSPQANCGCNKSSCNK